MKGGDVAGHDVLARFAEAAIDNIRETAANVAGDEFDAVVRLLADSGRPIHVLGGRFTGALAEYLVAHLRVLRPARAPHRRRPLQLARSDARYRQARRGGDLRHPPLFRRRRRLRPPAPPNAAPPSRSSPTSGSRRSRASPATCCRHTWWRRRSGFLRRAAAAGRGGAVGGRPRAGQQRAQPAYRGRAASRRIARRGYSTPPRLLYHVPPARREVRRAPAGEAAHVLREAPYRPNHP